MTMRQSAVVLAVFTFALLSACGGRGGGSGGQGAQAPSSAKAITAFSLSSPAATGVIDEASKTILVTVPSGTDVTALVATFTTTGASVVANGAPQVSGTTANNFSSPIVYTVTAADGTTVQYMVTVAVAPSSAKAITAFSFTSIATNATINEAAKTISLTVPFGTDVTALVATFTTTGASVAVGTTPQVSGATANNFTSPVVYTVAAADATTAQYTVTVMISANPAKSITSFGFVSPAVSGTINNGNQTIAVTMPFGTNVTALVATFITTGASVAVGATPQLSGTTANNFTNPVVYTVTAADGTTATYVVTVTVAQNPAKAITAFSFASPAATGAVNEAAKTVSLSVPFGTDVTALVATFTTTGADVAVGAAPQVSGTTANNFTNPVVYTVTAADGTTAQYTVTVIVALNPAKAITAFSFASLSATGVIDETAKTILVTVANGTDVTVLIATFTTTGASVSVGVTLQASGVTADDFINPVIYTVTAADSTTTSYTVTVIVCGANTTSNACTCSAGFANCDGLAPNGCEVNTSADANNCGACGNVCAIPNATANCAGGVCGVASCATGFGNCDGIAFNGCETPLDTVANCGNCGVTCPAPSCTFGLATVYTCSGGGCAANTTSCGLFACGASSCLTQCQTDVDCASFAFCAGGACAVKRGSGASCSANDQCLSGACATVCTHTTCTIFSGCFCDSFGGQCL